MKTQWWGVIAFGAIALLAGCARTPPSICFNEFGEPFIPSDLPQPFAQTTRHTKPPTQQHMDRMREIGRMHMLQAVRQREEGPRIRAAMARRHKG